MAETVLVTGSTGLIGSALVRKFAADGWCVLAAARNVPKAESLFAGAENVRTVRWDVTRPAEFPDGADAVIHAASETSSAAFVGRPVETIGTVIDGTRNVLEFARARRVRSMVFLSTMEVYGAPATDPVTERDYGYLDPVAVRSSYPEAKRLAENLCVAYAAEYGVPVKVARLTQTFGEGVRYDDGRVFAEFARAVIEGRDIVLKTEGTTARCYCHLGDAVEAIRTILAKGVAGEAYTVANEATFCTIREMAERVIAANPGCGSKLVFDFSDAAKRGFAPPFRMRLDCSKLRALGWTPKVGLEEAFARLIASMRESRARERAIVDAKGGRLA